MSYFDNTLFTKKCYIEKVTVIFYILHYICQEDTGEQWRISISQRLDACWLSG